MTNPLSRDLTAEAMRCARCKRFISPDTCLEGHDGTWFGSHPGAEDGYTGVYYCASGVGCNSDDAVLEAGE